MPQLSEIETTRDEKGRPHIRGKYQHWRPTGAWQTEDQFSDGTLRLMGLLWASLDGAGPLLLEEPELSLHPAVVRFLPQMFARLQRKTRRQIMLSTHSPDLLADAGIGLDEVFLLAPSKEGTKISAAGAFRDVVALLESDVDGVIVRRLATEAGLAIANVHVKNGKQNIRKSIRAYNAAARQTPFLVLVDLDREYGCAPELVADWLPHRESLLRVRVVVRAIEAWLLGDRANEARALRICRRVALNG